jgi:hypothetical protein
MRQILSVIKHDSFFTIKEKHYSHPSLSQSFHLLSFYNVYYLQDDRMPSVKKMKTDIKCSYDIYFLSFEAFL